jgi:hypothetical protein
MTNALEVADMQADMSIHENKDVVCMPGRTPNTEWLEPAAAIRRNALTRVPESSPAWLEELRRTFS